MSFWNKFIETISVTENGSVQWRGGSCDASCYASTIRFIVAWRPKDVPKEEKEHAVLLADLTLKNHLDKIQ